ncbi:hypothetical protein SAMN05443428_106141 [Caloramator quimbayensis]|uniref:Uncharacterized protein n=1 Tax=Caloramator quimbayensis TaxID=1147123 RepID=A0A1T4X6P7_9CLOT|nr:hypothetical protein [Caloramator quimbayensis]SKA85272.1 hypothetical protein SAMN05443428_106141 [Caloramator quimbayensis]
MDKFYEQLLTTKKNIAYYILNILMYVFAVLIFLSLIFSIITFSLGYMIFSLALIVILFFTRYLRDNQYKEFEYIFTNGNFQIDVIFNKKRRKTLIDEDIKNFDVFGKENEVNIESISKKINCIPYDNKGNRYVFVIKNDCRKAVYVAPNDEMLKMINLYYISRRR